MYTIGKENKMNLRINDRMVTLLDRWLAQEMQQVPRRLDGSPADEEALRLEEDLRNTQISLNQAIPRHRHQPRRGQSA